PRPTLFPYTTLFRSPPQFFLQIPPQLRDFFTSVQAGGQIRPIEVGAQSQAVLQSQLQKMGGVAVHILKLLRPAVGAQDGGGVVAPQLSNPTGSSQVLSARTLSQGLDCGLM